MRVAAPNPRLLPLEGFDVPGVCRTSNDWMIASTSDDGKPGGGPGAGVEPVSASSSPWLKYCARSAIVRKRKSSSMRGRRPSSRSRRFPMRTMSSELAPRLIKLSAAWGGGIPRTSATMPATRISVFDPALTDADGAADGGAAASSTGSAKAPRSTLPLAVSGSVASSTILARYQGWRQPVSRPFQKLLDRSRRGVRPRPPRLRDVARRERPFELRPPRISPRRADRARLRPRRARYAVHRS